MLKDMIVAMGICTQIGKLRVAPLQAGVGHSFAVFCACQPVDDAIWKRVFQPFAFVDMRICGVVSAGEGKSSDDFSVVVNAHVAVALFDVGRDEFAGGIVARPLFHVPVFSHDALCLLEDVHQEFCFRRSRLSDFYHKLFTFGVLFHYFHPVCLLQQEAAPVPVERLVFVVLFEDVVPECQSVHRFGIEDGGVEGVEFILFDKDAAFLASVEVLPLSLQIGYFGIDGDDGVGELELAGQRIDEAVLADDDVAAGSCLVPSVAIAAQEDGCSRSMVEQIVFYDYPLRSTEQGTPCPVVADDVSFEFHFGCPGEVFDAVAFLFADLRVDGVAESNPELAYSRRFLPVCGRNAGYPVGFPYYVHGGGTDKLDAVARFSPFKSPRLVVHVSSDEGMVVNPVYHLQVSAVHVDGIVHHSFV